MAFSTTIHFNVGAALTVSLGGNDFFINMALEKHLSFAVYAICLTLNALLQVCCLFCMRLRVTGKCYLSFCDNSYWYNENCS